MLKDHKVKTQKNQCKKQIKCMTSLLQALEYSIFESHQIDRAVLMSMRLDSLKNSSMKTKMEELEEENKQLLNMLHPRHDECNTSRTGSNSSCSTMSMVHLQYKYEELLANHNGLLKFLGLRMLEVRKYQEENAKLKQDIEKFRVSLDNYKDQIAKLIQKNRELKYRKNNKIPKLSDQPNRKCVDIVRSSLKDSASHSSLVVEIFTLKNRSVEKIVEIKQIMRLKNDRNTLAIIHNKLVNLLNKQCMEKDNYLYNELKETSKSETALLLQEIRKSNLLSYENFQLQQENEYLQSVLNLKKHNCSETMSV